MSETGVASRDRGTGVFWIPLVIGTSVVGTVASLFAWRMENLIAQDQTDEIMAADLDAERLLILRECQAAFLRGEVTADDCAYLQKRSREAQTDWKKIAAVAAVAVAIVLLTVTVVKR